MNRDLGALADCRAYFEANKTVLQPMLDAKKKAWATGEEWFYPPAGSQERHIIDQYERLSNRAFRAVM